MPPIISHSERQKIESSPTRVVGAHSPHPCVPVTFTSPQLPPVPSLTPPPPRHYLRNAHSSEKLQGLIRKRSDIYTRVQQAQQEEVDGSYFSHAPTGTLTRSSSSFCLAESVSPWSSQIHRSASWRTAIASRRRSRSPSVKSPTEVHVVESESLGAQRRETTVLGLSEVDAHLKKIFDSGDGATSVATHSSAHRASFDWNRSEPEFNGVLGLTTTAEQIPINHQIRVETQVRDTQGLNHNSILTLHRDAVALNNGRTAVPHHAQSRHYDAPGPDHSSALNGFTFPQRRRPRTLQRTRRPKEPFPPPRESSLVGHSLMLGPLAPDSIAARASSSPRAHPVGSFVDIVDSHTRSKSVSHRNRSKPAGCKAVSRAMRHLGDCFRSNGCTNAPGLSANL